MFNSIEAVKGKRGADVNKSSFIRVDTGRGYFSLSRDMINNFLIYPGLYCGILTESEKVNTHDVFKFAIFFSENSENCRKVYSNNGSYSDLRVKNTAFAKDIESLFPKGQVSVKLFVKKKVFFNQEINGRDVKIYPLFVDKELLKNNYPEYLELYQKYEDDTIRAYGEK